MQLEWCMKSATNVTLCSSVLACFILVNDITFHSYYVTSSPYDSISIQVVCQYTDVGNS